MLLLLALIQTYVLTGYVLGQDLQSSECPCLDVDNFRRFVPQEFHYYLNEFEAWYWQNSTSVQLRNFTQLFFNPNYHTYKYQIEPLLAQDLLQGIMREGARNRFTSYSQAEWNYLQEYGTVAFDKREERHFRDDVESSVKNTDFDYELRRLSIESQRLRLDSVVSRALSKRNLRLIHIFSYRLKNAKAKGASSLSEDISNTLQCWGFHPDLAESIQPYVEWIEWVAASLDGVDNLDQLKQKYPQLLPTLERIKEKYLSKSEIDKVEVVVKELLSTYRKTMMDNMDGILFLKVLDRHMRLGDLPGFSNYAFMMAKSIDDWFNRIKSSKNLLKTLGVDSLKDSPAADFITYELHWVYQLIKHYIKHIKDNLTGDVDEEVSLAAIVRGSANLIKKIDYHQLSEAILPSLPNCFKNTTTEVTFLNRKLAYPELFLYYIITLSNGLKIRVVGDLLIFPSFLFRPFE